jgi:hypothetical protein
VLEVLDSRLLSLTVEPRLLTDLLIDLTNAKDVGKAVDKAKDQELAKDLDLAKEAKIAKKPPFTTTNVNLLADTNSTAEQI